MNFSFIYAGAGCGKTTFIINEIITLIKKKEEKKILVITYTNSCVEDLKKKIKEALEENEENVEEYVSILTLHSLCYKYNLIEGVLSETNNLDLLLSYTEESAHKSFEEFYNYFLCHSPISTKIYREELEKEYAFGEKIENFENIKLEDFLRVDGKIREKIPKNYKDTENWEEHKIKIKNHFNHLNKTQNLIYFQKCKFLEKVREELKIYTYHHIILNVLNNIDNFVLSIFAKYKYIFIDEAQDLSHISFQIIKALCLELVYLEDHQLTLVGDINQSIYGFQGANVENFQNFLKEVKEIKQLNYEEKFLNKTYRFGGEILKLINKYFYFHESDRVEGRVYLYEPYKEEKKLITSIKNKIEKIRENKKDSILVLFQKRNNLSSELEKEFCSTKSNQKISGQNQMLQTFFFLIKYVVTNYYKDLINFLLGGMFLIEEPDFYNLVKKKQNSLEQSLQEKYGNQREFLTLEQLKKTNSLRDFLNIFENSILHKNAQGSYGNSINLLLEELRKIENLPLRLVLNLKKKDIWIKKEGDIHFSTVHNSKGMEADHVFIIDGNNKNNKSSIKLINNCPFFNFFPKEKEANHEFKNLLYVSLTRAKKTLHIFGQGVKINEDSLFYLLKDETFLKTNLE